MPLTDPNSRFGTGYQHLPSVLAEFEQLGIPRVLRIVALTRPRRGHKKALRPEALVAELKEDPSS